VKRGLVAGEVDRDTGVASSNGVRADVGSGRLVGRRPAAAATGLPDCLRICQRLVDPLRVERRVRIAGYLRARDFAGTEFRVWGWSSPRGWPPYTPTRPSQSRPHTTLVDATLGLTSGAIPRRNGHTDLGVVSRSRSNAAALDEQVSDL
jgi:hypothetical protein